AAVAALAQAARSMKGRFGALDVPYGEAYRIRYGGRDLPASVGNDDYGVFRAGFFRPEDDGTWSLIGGNTFVLIAEFGDQLRAEAILPYGNASQAGSPHIGDQLDLFVDGGLRAIRFTRDEVEAHVRRRDVLNR
ncbi:MAG: penicillin acylase family protein, partial [Caulobacterales bacterium]|nr:penicillin acylase family protein [Caulobacterales bacterium]